MKPHLWVPPAVFLAVSVPLVLLLNAIEVGGDFRIVIAIGVGALATAFAQSKLKQRSSGEQE